MSVTTDFLHGPYDFEQSAIDAYADTVGDFIEAFYGADHGDWPLELMVTYLREWWTAIDTLDSMHGDRPSLAAARHLADQCDNFFRARQSLLLSIAIEAGHLVPQPDHTDGHVKTSNHYLGSYGFADLTTTRTNHYLAPR